MNHAAVETQEPSVFFCRAPVPSDAIATPVIRVNTDPSSTAARTSPAALRADDEVCALRARAGDTAAMESLVLRHQGAVARLLWRFAGTRADLDDLVQETFLRMVRGLGNWRADQPFAHWLLRIATNTGRDYFRRQSVRRRYAAETENTGATASGQEIAMAEAADPAADPAARAAANEVKELLAGLPPDDRSLLTLYYLEGRSLTEIAAGFGWTVTAAKLRAWRARARLRALLKERAPFSPD